jgi:hypothetical protein
MATSRFPLQPLLERSRRFEERCFRDWLPLESERAACVDAMSRCENSSFEQCGAPASTAWWQRQMVEVASRHRSRLGDVEAAWRVAYDALCDAKRHRRIYEKLEERFAAAERSRRERRERAAIDESNAMSRASSAGAR